MKTVDLELQFKLRTMVEMTDELPENVIYAGTVEEGNYGKLGHEEGEVYYIYYENKWYYCQYLSIITGFTGKEYEPYRYGVRFNFEECNYVDVAVVDTL